jgi:hypothetical protein
MRRAGLAVEQDNEPDFLARILDERRDGLRVNAVPEMEQRIQVAREQQVAGELIVLEGGLQPRLARLEIAADGLQVAAIDVAHGGQYAGQHRIRGADSSCGKPLGSFAGLGHFRVQSSEFRFQGPVPSRSRR